MSSALLALLDTFALGRLLLRAMSKAASIGAVMFCSSLAYCGIKKWMSAGTLPLASSIASGSMQK